MSIETIALQRDMFSGELVDTRSGAQKRRDEARSNPQQMQMFTTPEMVQDSAHTCSAYKEWLDEATAPPLALAIQDIRTIEEIEHDLEREAQKRTKPLFEIEEQGGEPETTEHRSTGEPTLPTSVLVFDAQTYRYPVGLRTKLRAMRISERIRLRSA